MAITADASPAGSIWQRQPAMAVKKISSGRPRKVLTDMTAEEAYYRALKPPCTKCGQSNTEFRYFNNRYRTKGSRVSSLDQPRYRCVWPCMFEFTYGTRVRRSTSKRKFKKTMAVDSFSDVPVANPSNGIGSFNHRDDHNHPPELEPSSSWSQLMTGVWLFFPFLGSH